MASARQLETSVRAAEFRARQLVLSLARLVSRPASARAGIQRLERELRPSEDEESPIFILGAGWRSGSTWLQRVVNSQSDTLVWGEPYGDGGIVQSLAESLRFLDPDQGRLHSTPLRREDPVPGASVFTATLSPSLDNLADSYRALLLRLLRDPAAERGFVRWGVKEVIWDRDCIHLLRMVFPSARFVLLVRDPETQWASYRPETRRPWYFRWPDKPIGTPLAFARMWRALVDDFVTSHREFGGVALVTYEALRSPEELERLTRFLGLPEPLRDDVGTVGSSRGHRFYYRVPRWERLLIRVVTRRGRRHFGYA